MSYAEGSSVGTTSTSVPDCRKETPDCLAVCTVERTVKHWLPLTHRGEPSAQQDHNNHRVHGGGAEPHGHGQDHHAEPRDHRDHRGGESPTQRRQQPQGPQGAGGTTPGGGDGAGSSPGSYNIGLRR